MLFVHLCSGGVFRDIIMGKQTQRATSLVFLEYGNMKVCMDGWMMALLVNNVLLGRYPLHAKGLFSFFLSI